ncbi:MAG TPA: 4Fe-4S binding protein [Anaerolineaceae bacterium]|nr:4Fe-4S binding protein [Anaerolineaceae bacterium]
MHRAIITIDEALCNGCGLCVGACHECAIELVNGKARLVKEEYCDGLGNCLPECPTGAIRMVEREAAPYSEAAVIARLAATQPPAAKAAVQPVFSACDLSSKSGSVSRRIEPCCDPAEPSAGSNGRMTELGNWPVQLQLVNVRAPSLADCRLLVAADCTAFASAAFHSQLLRGRTAVIGCPKLDDTPFYTEKLAQIFELNRIESVLVARMEVPCCSGITAAVRRAVQISGKAVPIEEVIVTNDGRLINL